MYPMIRNETNDILPFFVVNRANIFHSFTSLSLFPPVATTTSSSSDFSLSRKSVRLSRPEGEGPLWYSEGDPRRRRRRKVEEEREVTRIPRDEEEKDDEKEVEGEDTKRFSFYKRRTKNCQTL